MLPAVMLIAALFGLLLMARIGASRRSELLRRWPAALFALAAIAAAARGAVAPALWLAGASALCWVLWPRITSPISAPGSREADPADREARSILGVGADASEADIRRAYRDKIARAHPDRGGAHADAARLTAARDRLLRRKA